MRDGLSLYPILSIENAKTLYLYRNLSPVLETEPTRFPVPNTIEKSCVTYTKKL